MTFLAIWFNTMLGLIVALAGVAALLSALYWIAVSTKAWYVTLFWIILLVSLFATCIIYGGMYIEVSKC